MAKLTLEQKRQKTLRDQQTEHHNSVLSAWNFGSISRDWNGVLSKLGYSQEYRNTKFADKQGELTFPQLKDFLASLKDKLEKEIEESSKKPLYENNTTLQSTDIQAVREVPSQASQEVNGVSLATKALDKIQECNDRESGESNKREVRDTIVTDLPRVLKSVTPSKLERTADNDYLYTRSPNISKDWHPFWHQKKAVSEAIEILKDKPVVMILAGTGTGKTGIVGDLIRHFIDTEFHEGRTFSHIPYVYVTKASIVTQTSRVLKNAFNIDVDMCEVINIEMLRSRAGQYWLKEEVTLDEGEEVTKWIWKKGIQPAFIPWDECQVLKNAGSQQHQIACALNDMPLRVRPKQAFVSATPFTKVIEAKCFAVATGKSLDYINGKRTAFPEGTILTNETWPSYAKAIAYPSSPEEYNEAACERLMSDLEEYVVRVKGVRPQFEAVNSIERINFKTAEEKREYMKAWEDYLEKKAKAESEAAMTGKGNGLEILVQFLIFRMKAELMRSGHIADEMYKIVEEKNKAAVCFFSFKNSIIKTVQLLVEKYGVPREKISIIWGGGQTQLTKAQKQKKKIMGMTQEQLDALGMTQEELLETVDLDDVEDREIMDIPEYLRLGIQTPEARQLEIDKFQRGDSLYCFYTLKAGGVGLSLHHSDELTKFKCRRKESGYAVEEDIPLVPVREREVLGCPTWSPIELVQGVGRVPRLTSLSKTVQRLIFYNGTIESRVADIANRGLRCLSKIVKHKESWSQMVTSDDTSTAQKYIDTLPEESSPDDLEEGEEE